MWRNGARFGVRTKLSLCSPLSGRVTARFSLWWKLLPRTRSSVLQLLSSGTRAIPHEQHNLFTRLRYTTLARLLRRRFRKGDPRRGREARLAPNQTVLWRNYDHRVFGKMGDDCNFRGGILSHKGTAMKRIYAVLLVSLVLAMVLAVHRPAWGVDQPAASAVAEYTISAVPQFEQRKLYAIWKPIVDELARRTGLRLKLVSTLTIQDFHRAYGEGQFDFAYVNPYNILYFHDTQGYIPLVADKAPLRGILVVQKDSSIKTVADLDGQTVAFPSPNAVGASLLIRAELERVYRVRVTPLYVTTHSSVYFHVAKGLTVAGGGVEKTLQEQPEVIKAQLRVIFTTRPCPSHPVAAHPRVPPEVREKVRAALLAMGETPEGKEMLAKVPISQAIPVTYDDYAIMSTWGLEKYWRPGPDPN